MKIKNISNRKESQIKNLFDNYEFIAFVSYSNFNQDQIHKFKLFLSELGLSIKFIRNKRLKESLSDTRFKNMNRIFLPHSTRCRRPCGCSDVSREP